jgi:ABC-2 type transport system ATP-binding protein
LDILVVDKVSKSYAQHQALKEVSLNVPKQSIFGLLGPNGAGKTTLIRIITQIIDADRGEIFVNGEKLNPHHIGVIGYLPEERGLYKKMKIGEQLLYLAQLKGMKASEARQKAKHWLDKLGLMEWVNKNVEDLSKGMQQKVQFISTVMHEPELIILDEPFSGFDPINANLIKDEILKLREKGCTIIFSTHRMESVEELCDHIALINKSQKILDGSKKEIKEAYKSNTFLVEYASGNLSALPETFNLLNEETQAEGLKKATIQIQNDLKPNALLQQLIGMVEVHSFVEKIPSINDIFISKVQEGNASLEKKIDLSIEI